ncbi:MAG: glycosyltransferase family 4 protein [Chloroflexi bacterium]|nr:glycosyltransferase family 4 protein [Chloroflexota bacterium]
MKILFVTPQPPVPARKGTALRNAALIQHAARHHEVQVLSLLAPGERLHPAAAATLGAPVISVPVPPRSRRQRLRDLVTRPLPDLALRLRSPSAQERLVALLRQFRPEVVQFEAVEAAGAVGPLGAAFRAAGRRPRLIYDAHNAEFALQRRLAQAEFRRPLRWPLALYSLLQWQRLGRWEAGLCRAAAAVIAVSADDAADLERLAGVRPTVIPNGVDSERYRPAADGPPLDPTAPTLLFLGALNYRPNIEAVTWFTREVLPLVRKEFPSAHLVIAGHEPAPAVRKLASPHVRVLGSVEDDLPLLHQASICVVPLRSGGGMRFKVVQAMAAGVPVVTTLFGAAGIAARQGEHLLYAETPAAFCEAIRRTLCDPTATRARLARARALVVARYDWQSILPALTALYARLAETPAPVVPR